MVDKIQIRRGTSSQWNSSNPTLSSGEFGLDTITYGGTLPFRRGMVLKSFSIQSLL